MIDTLRFAITLAAALGCGLMAGVFFAFSTFVMRALARLPASEGIAAMQSINLVVVSSGFLVVFLATAAACAVALIAALLRWRSPGTAYLLSGCALYLLGSFLVTMLCNVPLNNALAAVAPSDPASASQWASYLSSWMRWNHLRTAAALAAAAALTLALIQPPERSPLSSRHEQGSDLACQEWACLNARDSAPLI